MKIDPSKMEGFFCTRDYRLPTKGLICNLIVSAQEEGHTN